MIQGFHGPPTPARRGFNEGWSLVTKSHVKSLASPTVTELDR